MKRARDTIDVSSLDHKQLRDLRREIREREIELWQSQLIKKNIEDIETKHYPHGPPLTFAKITYDPIDLPKEFIDKFGECIDVTSIFVVGCFKVTYRLSKEPKYKVSQYYKEKNIFANNVLIIEIEGDTHDGTMYYSKYADKIKITFKIHKNQRYYEILTLYRLDKTVHYQGKIELTDSDFKCLSDVEPRKVGKLEEWNVCFSKEPEVSKEKEMFSQNMIDFWTCLFDKIFFQSSNSLKN